MKLLGPETVAFLRALAANNDRVWFAENKAAYEEHFKTPADAFAHALADKISSGTGITHSHRIFRVHRDLRFAKDKTPYSAHLHISLVPDDDCADSPSWMFGLDPHGLDLGVGIFEFSKPGLVRWRERVCGPDGDALAGMLARLRERRVRIDEPELKRPPAPFAPDHPHASLLRRRGLTAWIDRADSSIALGPEGPAQCAHALFRLRDIFDWLRCP